MPVAAIAGAGRAPEVTLDDRSAARNEPSAARRKASSERINPETRMRIYRNDATSATLGNS
jgi:hypothetical protein